MAPRKMPGKYTDPGKNTQTISNAITTGPGNFIGNMIAKARLGGKQSSGTYTATQTGARQQALQNQARRNNKAVMDSASNTQDFEDLISGKKKSY